MDHYAPRTTRLGIASIGVFCALSLFLVSVDFVPERRVDAKQADLESQVEDLQRIDSGTLAVTPVSTPTRVVIESIGVDTSVVTPESADIEVLDRALLTGAVHYPGSPRAGEAGNMLLFGHSSYLPVVKNKAYQAFNELGSLTPGERVIVYSEGYRYEYLVKSVRLARAQDAVINFIAREPTLTLATCNTFGQKQERWVVTASLDTVVPHQFQ
ncbi:MAG: sortase [Candidatus Pacebacteria bacterium]|nr:sortase [Candidatus Paceibacterota bacterium]